MKGGRTAAVVLFLAAVAVGAYAYFSPQRPSVSVAMEKAVPLDHRPLRLPLKDPRVVIRKRARELTLYDGAQPLRRFRVVLGANVSGDKEREGDKRTPEGTFYICTRNDGSRFHKFMGLSYPAPSDALRGLKASMITRSEHDAILKAHELKSCPPWKTALGGEVGIHGGGIDRDWTLGCIALTNDAIDELWSALKMGDPVLIEP
jgi:murein L,D-transpeptidase YafK